jgi:hypothetical protein
VSLVVGSPLARAGLIAGSLATIVAGVMTSRGAFLAMAVALLIPIATSLSQAGRLAVSLRSLRGRAIDALVWGAPVAGSSAVGLRVESVGAVGAGLLIYLSDRGGSRALLKVAQPRSWRVEDARVIVDDAAYVQWAGRRLPRAEGLPALEIRVATSAVA